eukprot:CAMPEP_0206010304 /NCGR_PEP_ID=MMETSP1464-20131121/11351_1 /ASSEMBLY_ACC=CAM_ASM_001124 /TAXON_ID=119497 /ORGANISM="Exanthemachrysis gayraliae, Strain RCC1523" /LENGTH=284 /DNA_ID=CAMNT_0053383929 /DNA_START=13 /DNA_END=867 /DNA_ORIENTATION=+
MASSCIPLVELLAGVDAPENRFSRQIRRMADVVSSDSVTRAFLQLTQRSGKRLTVVDRETKRALRVKSLSQLPLGRMYIYGEGHTIIRNALDRVVLAGKVHVSIAPLPAQAADDLGPPKQLTMNHDPGEAETPPRASAGTAGAGVASARLAGADVGQDAMGGMPGTRAAHPHDLAIAVERTWSSEAMRLPTPEPAQRRHSGYLHVSSAKVDVDSSAADSASLTRRSKRLASVAGKRSEARPGRPSRVLQLDADAHPAEEVRIAVRDLVDRVSSREAPDWGDELD